MLQIYSWALSKRRMDRKSFLLMRMALHNKALVRAQITLRFVQIAQLVRYV